MAKHLVLIAAICLAALGCKKKEAPAPAPPAPTGPCTWERLEAYRPQVGIIVTRERLPETTAEERTEVVKEARPNCDVAENKEQCRARILSMVKTWVGADVTIELEEYEEPDAHRWRGTHMEVVGKTVVGGQEYNQLADQPETARLFDTSDECLAYGRARYPMVDGPKGSKVSRFGCSPAASWGFVFRGVRKKTETTKHGMRLQVLWLEPKGADPAQALADLTADATGANFKVLRSARSEPRGWEVDLACP